MKFEFGKDAKNHIKSSPSLTELYKEIQGELKEVEEQLKLFSDPSNKLISEINTYIFRNTGKRIRPALLLLCTKLISYNGSEHILMCSLVEALHTASLIHDDIIDNSDLRRGQETVHLRWGPNITVLLGDYLYIKALGLSLQSEYPKIIELLTDTSSQMVEGELFEYAMSGNLDIREDEYLDIIRKKTASLFSSTCQIAGVLGEIPGEEEEYLAEFGMNFGMSFQIIDDLLDYTGEESSLGKPVLSDLSEGRITLPLIYSLNNGNASNRKMISEFLKDKSANKKSQVIELVKSNGALEYTFKKAEEFSDLSKNNLKEFPDSLHRQALSSLSDFVLFRNK